MKSLAEEANGVSPAWAVAFRKMMHGGRAAGELPYIPQKPIEHGKNGGYTYYGCRCSRCSDAHREANRAWRAKRKVRVI